MNCCLGIDTSCYTTSCALVDEQGQVVAAQRRLLPVGQGERGLRQSEAVFAHVRQMPLLIEGLLAQAEGANIAAVCVSTKPVDDEDSYMPVFRAGESFVRVIAVAGKLPVYSTTHQRGHLAAASHESGPLPSEFLALHLSGGTSELLLVEGDRLRRLGQSNDLHAGQLVDRIGVGIGMSFPAGPELELLAKRGTAKGRYPAIVNGLDCHLSGVEAQALRDLKTGAISPGDVAAEVFDALTRTILKMLRNASEEFSIQDALLFGGVASSTLLREMITQRSGARRLSLQLHFGKPELSGDNAVGVALIGARKHFGLN